MCLEIRVENLIFKTGNRHEEGLNNTCDVDLRPEDGLRKVSENK